MTNNWTAGHVIAGLLWAAALALCIGDLFVRSNDIGHLGILAGALAGTTQIRCWLETSRQRDKDFYELGKDVAMRRPRGV